MNRFKALIKGWIDYQAKINGKVHKKSKATNLQKTSSNNALRRLRQSKCDSYSKDDIDPNSENNKPQSVLVHHLRF